MARGGIAVACSIAVVTLLSGCGAGSNSGAAVDLTDPVNVAQGYATAVQGKVDGGQEYLQKDINDGIPLTGPTDLSKFLDKNKGAKWEIATVNYPAPGTTNPKPTKKACTVIPPQGGELCIVTLQVSAGDKPTWFHLSVESRYPPGKWLIVDVDQVDGKPDNLLPSGNEAHTS